MLRKDRSGKKRLTTGRRPYMSSPWHLCIYQVMPGGINRIHSRVWCMAVLSFLLVLSFLWLSYPFSVAVLSFLCGCPILSVAVLSFLNELIPLHSCSQTTKLAPAGSRRIKYL